MKLINLFTLFILLQTSLKSQTIHFLSATDLSDQDFAIVTNKSYTHFIKVFKTINTNLGYEPIKETYLSGNKFTAEYIKNSIKNFVIKPNDIVVFYYSGKVNYPAKSISEYPYLNLNDAKANPISFDEIANLLKAKGARLAIAIADGRNTKVRLETPEKPDDRNTEVVANNRVEIIKHLMNTTCGLVKIASNMKNEPAYVISNRTKIYAIPNSNDYKIVSDPNEYSVFSISFVEVFERILQKARALYKFNGLIRGVEYRINKELNPTDSTKRKQELQWEIQSCEKPIANNKIFVNLEEDLNDLLVIKNASARQNFIAKLIEKYSTLKTEYHVLRISNSAINMAKNKRNSIFTKLSSYLATLKEYNPKIMSVVILETPIPGNDLVITKLEEFYSE